MKQPRSSSGRQATTRCRSSASTAVSVNLASDERLRQSSGCRRSSTLSTAFHVSGGWRRTAGSTRPTDRQKMTLTDNDCDWWRWVLKSTTDDDGPHRWRSLAMDEDGGWWWWVLMMRSHDDEWCWRYLRVDDELFTRRTQTEHFSELNFFLLTVDQISQPEIETSQT